MASNLRRLTRRALGRIGLLGAAAGAINAWLCYAGLPVPVRLEGELFGGATPVRFPWTVIPAGAVHGALLAIVPVGLAAFLRRKPLWLRLAVAVAAGWGSGWLSWMPMNLIFQMGWSNYASNLPALAVWPFCYFGLAGLLYYAWLNFGRGLASTRLSAQLAAGSLSGALGALWFWTNWGVWYFSLLHGTIWGCLVGYGVWRSQQGPPQRR